MKSASKKRLGRGLAALIGDDTTEESVIEDARSLRHVPIEFLKASPKNPRKSFSDDDLSDLARSISEKGLLQPLVVRPGKEENTYEIVAGERRWRAAQLAGVFELPVLIRELSDGEMLEIALIENIQRSDLNPIEEATGYSRLIEEFKYTQQELANSVGKSRSHIANMMRLLTLPGEVIEQVEKGDLTAGHARTLVAAEDPKGLAAKIIDLGLSVRDAEQLIREPEVNKSVKVKPAAKAKNSNTQALEKELGEKLGLVVEINEGSKESGKLVIKYKNLDQLEDVCARLRK